MLWPQEASKHSILKPPPGNLPTDRTKGSSPFQVLGADYAGPIAYKLKPKKEGKLLFACSLTRAIHLELLPDQTTEEFIRSFKRFIARRRRPEKIYTYNGRSFVGAAKWLKNEMKDEQFQNYLAHHNGRFHTRNGQLVQTDKSSQMDKSSQTDKLSECENGMDTILDGKLVRFCPSIKTIFRGRSNRLDI